MITYKEIAEALEERLNHGDYAYQIASVRGIIALLKRCEGVPDK